MTFDNPVLLIVAGLTAVFGVGRLSRIATYDDFPPAVWIRMQWGRITKDGSWTKLLYCQWCATPWIMAICLAWGYFSALHWTWFAFWGWLGLSYLASIVIAHDESD